MLTKKEQELLMMLLLKDYKNYSIKDWIRKNFFFKKNLLKKNKN